MSAPRPPSDFLKLIPSVTAAFCGRFLDFLKFPALFAELYSYERTEQGDISDAFCADIGLCIGTLPVGGGGGGGGGTGTLNTPVVTATDGAFTDKIVISWNAIAPITGSIRYEVWRGDSNNATLAHKLSDVNTVSSFTDDGSHANFPLVSGQIYWYFIRAFDDGGNSSSYSQGDSGYEGALVSTLTAVADLVATKGAFSHAIGAQVCLVWAKIANATAYDIWRNTNDDFTTATRIGQNVTPYVFTDSNPTYYGNTGLVDNGTELAYHDTVGTSAGDPNAWKNYYYWVVPKRTNPIATGDFSTASGAVANSKAGALGWGFGQGQGMNPFQVLPYLLVSGAGATSVPAGATKAWVGVFGGKAGGAGGNLSLGGGGGGAGAMVTGLITVAATGAFRVVSSPEADPGNAGTATNGTDGPQTKVQYSALGTFADTVDVVTCAVPGGGVWNAAGGGAGGAGATAAVDASLTPNNIYAGRAGFAASGSAGGDSGYLFGFFRGPSNVTLQFDHPGDASTTHAGGGSNSNPQGAILALGAKGLRGAAFLVFY